MPRLIRSNCGAPGIARRRRGRGFEYLDPDGQHIDDPEMLERIAALAIPPAWREVWICMDPRGHLQATGLDAAGRKQYLYHEHWRSHRDRQKFDSMLAFGTALPRLRRRVARDLRPARKRQSGWLAPADLSAPVVLACSVRLLDLGFFRIGSEHYAECNESYGLTTMLRRHVTIDKGEVVFDFPAKSGQRRIQAIADDEVMQILLALKRRRSGTQLLAYRDADERWVEVHAEEVNDYIKRHAGGEFTAKDFRTWNASVLAAVALAGHDRPASRAQRERKVRAAIETVASYLGNTPAVCRASYVDPRVIDRYQAGVTIAATLADLPAAGPDLSKPSIRKRIESAVIDLLAEHSLGHGERHKSRPARRSDVESVVRRVGLDHGRSRAAKHRLNADIGGSTMAKDHGPSVKNDKQYEGLREKGMSKERAAKIANSPGASKRGGESSGSGTKRRATSQGGTKAQKAAAGRKGGKKSS